MAAQLEHLETAARAEEDGQWYYVVNEAGCFVWQQLWDVGGSSEAVEPSHVLTAGTEFLARSHPAFDDQLPLSTIRGCPGGLDDQDNPSYPSTHSAQFFHWLQVVSPLQGWILDTEIDTVSRARQPGRVNIIKGRVLESSRWLYRVVCADGAVVRSGLELSSDHKYTVRQHAIIEISERKINEQGLARLRTADERGWISEQLNPLSGHRGPVVSLLKMPRPLRFNVILPEGAVVRRTMELSSMITRVVPTGEVISIDAKSFSNHPATHCIPRLKLASESGGGWISQRLNRLPPDDVPVVIPQDTQCPGGSDVPFYEYSSRREGTSGGGGGAGTANGGNAGGNDPLCANGVDEEEEDMSLARATARKDLMRFSASAKRAREGSQSPEAVDETEIECIVCLSAPRQATIVHGETGHIACCMECARILKAKGDRCPVCRMSIDLVIQHFWA
uniref:RING-type domain-containing protein n=1 Tax=Rhizochromulina marina TaxID=1034831 RepID=A0A7S2S0R0_9STRA